MTDKKITIETSEGNDLYFNISLSAYNTCIDAMQTDNKVSPMHQFLMRCALDEPTRKHVKTLYEQGLLPDLFGVVLEEYKPKISFTIKKSKAVASR